MVESAGKDRSKFRRCTLSGTEISKEDGDKINAILKKHDKEIYKLQTYRNGQLIKTKGSLKDLVLDQELISAMAANVKKAGFAQFAIQLGVGHNPQRVVTSGPAPTPVSSSNPQRINSEPSATPTGGGVTHAQQIRESRELVTELKPMLDTYKNK